MEQLINTGIVAINKTAPNTAPEKTVIVLGAARSGTSMMAQVVEAMGVFIGKKKDGAVFEDVEISGLIEEKKVEGLKQLIAERDAIYPVWGWKRPASFDHLSWVLPLVRNPHLIFMFRDPLAIALRNNISMDSDFLKSLKESNETYARIIQFLGQTKVPSLLVSYEKSILKRERFLRDTATFLGLKNINVDAVLRKIELDKPIYLVSSTIKKATGTVTLKNGKYLKGNINSTAGKALIDISITKGGREIADVIRLEVNNAFEIDLSPHLKPGYNCIAVKSAIGGEHIKQSPFLSYSPIEEMERKLMFVHIPKTAGTSFRNMLREIFKAEEIFPNAHEIRENNRLYPPINSIVKLSEERLHKLRLINGHYLPIEYKALPFHLDIAVFFREPKARLISNLRHFQMHDKSCSGLSLQEIFVQRKDKLENLQIKYIASDVLSAENLKTISIEEFAVVINPILKHLKFIGVSERFEESLKLFSWVFGMPLPMMQIVNRSKEGEEIGPGFLNEIEQFVQKENWLYKLVIDEFQKRLNVI